MIETLWKTRKCWGRQKQETQIEILGAYNETKVSGVENELADSHALLGLDCDTISTTIKLTQNEALGTAKIRGLRDYYTRKVRNND